MVSPVRTSPTAWGTRFLNWTCGSKIGGTPKSACSNSSRTSLPFAARNSSDMKARPTTKLERIARTTSSTLGISSTREMSMVSICGQDGKPRSAITSVFVWRTRLMREFIAGFRMPVFSMNVRAPLQQTGGTLPDPDSYAQRTRHWLLGNHNHVSAAAAGIHGAGVTGLKPEKNPLQIDVNQRMPHGVRQKNFPTPHAMVHGGAETADVGVQDRIKTVLACPAQLRDPPGIEVSNVQGTVAGGTLVDGDEMEDFFHPTCNLRVAVGFDMRRKSSPLEGGIVIKPAHARIEQANHVLRAGRFGLSGILRPVQLADQF